MDYSDLWLRPCTMFSIYITFFILWAWHACVVDLDIGIEDTLKLQTKVIALVVVFFFFGCI